MSETSPIDEGLATLHKDSTPEESSNEASSIEESSGYTTVQIVLAVIIVAVVVALLYYGYNRFVTNSISEPFVEGQRQERSDTVSDYNLSDAIKKLERIQSNVLKQLSSSTGL